MSNLMLYEKSKIKLCFYNVTLTLILKSQPIHRVKDSKEIQRPTDSTCLAVRELGVG